MVVFLPFCPQSSFLLFTKHDPSGVSETWRGEVGTSDVTNLSFIYTAMLMGIEMGTAALGSDYQGFTPSVVDPHPGNTRVHGGCATSAAPGADASPGHPCCCNGSVPPGQHRQTSPAIAIAERREARSESLACFIPGLASLASKQTLSAAPSIHISH